MSIKDILSIDLSEEIKSVVDLEDREDSVIISEIEKYIVTDGIAKHYTDFASTFLDNVNETGVWISGFYGSGKSYFGKLLGYLIGNPNLNGTEARERILQRFTGLNDEALVRNSLSRLSTKDSLVVTLDIAKQETSKGLAFTLFRNFLKSLNLPENEHGFFLYLQLYNARSFDIDSFIRERANVDWSEVRKDMIEYVNTSKRIFLNTNDDNTYSNIMETIRGEIAEFSASKLRDELRKYLDVDRNKTVVFMFDEASEAINQRKFTLLDLEGISEALTALGGRVWTIAIAQEKLDDVINNSNISVAQLTKVTDRFRTKIHLESSEVDVIIKNRLLRKTDEGNELLNRHFNDRSGQIADHSALNGAGKTDNIESYTTYYPFYNGQFQLLQNFLFGRQGYTSTKVAERGMIITTYDILRNELKDRNLYDVATGWQIAGHAQPQPPVHLVNRFTNADRILSNNNIPISGRTLLETIHFLTESEVVPTTIQNITKSFCSKSEEVRTVTEDMKVAIELLCDSQILLFAEGKYRITSDTELNLLNEMKQFQVQPRNKKSEFVKLLKDTDIVSSISKVRDVASIYEFSVMTDSDEPLNRAPDNNLKLKLKSIFNISENRNNDIESLKLEYQNDKSTIWIVPDNSAYQKIDDLIIEIKRIEHLEERYTNPETAEKKIVNGLSGEKSGKVSKLKDLIVECIKNGTLIYNFNADQLDPAGFVSKIQQTQMEAINSIYYKRLPAQLNEDIAVRFIAERSPDRLHNLTNVIAADFHFFDAQGRYVGDNLRPAEEVTNLIRNAYVRGNDLEDRLKAPPTGYLIGTIMTTVSALMRGSKLTAKYNGRDFFSWQDEGLKEIFISPRAFRNASFKALQRTLSAEQRNDIVNALRQINVNTYTEVNVDWNTNDFDLARAVKDLAKKFTETVAGMERDVQRFAELFPSAVEGRDCLSEFLGAVSDSNYLEKCEQFLAETEHFEIAVTAIIESQNFIRTKLPELNKWKSFIDSLDDEIEKANIDKTDENTFNERMQKVTGLNVVENYSAVQRFVQKAKDFYFNIFNEKAEILSAKYRSLRDDIKSLIREIETLPPNLNDDCLVKANSLLDYSSRRVLENVAIDFDVKDRNSKFTLSEIISFTELYSTKKTELEIIRNSLLRKAPVVAKGKKTAKNKPVINSKAPSGKMKVSEYRSWLHSELQKLASADDNDDINIET